MYLHTSQNRHQVRRGKVVHVSKIPARLSVQYTAESNMRRNRFAARELDAMSGHVERKKTNNYNY